MPNGSEGSHHPGNQENNSHRDLVKWTRAVALFTCLLFLANAFGLFFIYEQWKVASNAQVDTREQLRAVVSPPTFNEFIVNDKDGKPLAYAFQPQYFNSGSTRTAIFRAWQSIHYFAQNVPNNMDFSEPFAKIDIVDSIIGGNSPSNMQPVTLTVDEANKVIQKQGTALIWGHADWSDIFSPKDIHHISFCMRLESISLIGGATALKPVPYKPDCNTSH